MDENPREDVFTLMNEDDDVDEPDADTAPPTAKKGKTPAIGHCSDCRVPVYTHEGFKKHFKWYLLNGSGADNLFLSAPSKNMVLEECKVDVHKVLQGLIDEEDGCGINPECLKIAKHLVLSKSSHWIECFGSELWRCLPVKCTQSMSAFHLEFVKMIEELSNNKSTKEELLKCLTDSIPVPCSAESLDWCFGHLFLSLSKKVEVFYLKCLQSSYSDMLNSVSYQNNDYTDNPNFQQCVHYIGGSAVHSVYQAAVKGTENPTWINVVTCLTTRFWKIYVMMAKVL